MSLLRFDSSEHIPRRIGVTNALYMDMGAG